MENKFLVCIDCGQDFVFTEGEQQFFRDRVLAPPKRCPGCRVAKREEMETRRNETKRLLPDTKQCIQSPGINNGREVSHNILV